MVVTELFMAELGFIRDNESAKIEVCLFKEITRRSM